MTILALVLAVVALGVALFVDRRISRIVNGNNALMQAKIDALNAKIETLNQSVAAARAVADTAQRTVDRAKSERRG